MNNRCGLINIIMAIISFPILSPNIGNNYVDKVGLFGWDY